MSPPFKEQSCWNSSAKNYDLILKYVRSTLCREQLEEYGTSREGIHQADLGNMLSSDAKHCWSSMGDSLLAFRLLRWWYYRVSGGYTMLPANVKPHVVAAMFSMETPIDGAEQ